MYRQKRESVVIAVGLKQQMANQLDALALKRGIKTSKLITHFIVSGLQELKILKNCGILEEALLVLSFLSHGTIDKGINDYDIIHRMASISVRIDKGLNDEIERWAIELGKTKNGVIENCICITVDNLNMLNIIDSADMLTDIIRNEDKNEKKIIKNWKCRFKDAKAMGNEIFKINLKKKYNNI